MKFWFYRPDIELLERKLNKNYIYDLNGANYFQYVEKKNRVKIEYEQLKETKRKRICSMKMEVPND